jgi:5-methylcytosine-specific restriction endonuclease McrA
MDYVNYIASSLWRNNRARVRELETTGGKCRLCSAPDAAVGPLEAHHRDYDNLGNEQDGDLVALCGECHREVTSFLRRRRYLNRAPLRADVPRMRDGRTALCDPTRGECAR